MSAEKFTELASQKIRPSKRLELYIFQIEARKAPRMEIHKKKGKITELSSLHPTKDQDFREILEYGLEKDNQSCRNRA